MQDSKLQVWISKQIIGDGMLWENGFGRQVSFVRDCLTPLVGSGLDIEDIRKIPDVISTHRSKSITLPVYELSRPDLGLRFILRGNFYNWKLSIISEKPIETDFSGLFYTTPPVEPTYTGDHLHPVYFEGFPKDLIFGYYETSDKRKFSAEIYSDEALWTTIFLIMRSVGAVRPMLWHTKDSHRKALDERSARHKAREEAKVS